MKPYNPPVWQVIFLPSDAIMASDENELTLDTLSSIFNLR